MQMSATATPAEEEEDCTGTSAEIYGVEAKRRRVAENRADEDPSDEVLAGRLAELLGGGGDVEDIVRDLINNESLSLHC